MRAAQFIVHNYREEPLGREAFLEACKEALEEEMRFAEEALSKTDGLNLEIARGAQEASAQDDPIWSLHPQ